MAAFDRRSPEKPVLALIALAAGLAGPGHAQDANRAQDVNRTQSAAASVPADAPAFAIGDVPWNARAVEHLYSRAAFGIAERDIPALAARAPEEVVDRLLDGGRVVEPFLAQRFGLDQYRDMRSVAAPDKTRMKAMIRIEDRFQLRDYGCWWLQTVLDEVDPLRDRMTLFWSGFFTTNARELRRNYEVIRQHQFLREHALESYASLLAGIVRDPAMIYYLDNASNRAGSPNENLARELMELFSLGEGNYSEEDVREVARALTGFTADREGQFVFEKDRHDDGVKRILGEEGRFDGDAVVQILLRQKACAEWVTKRLIGYLEGQPPSDVRIARYAELLRTNDYALRPFLRTLFLDPDFYRSEVVGTRVQGPIDFVVSSAHRLGVKPPPRYVFEAATSLGQHLFEPPNVKGWEEGEAWITTASLLQRGNVAGLLLGVVDLDVVFPGRFGAETDAEMEPSMRSMEPEMDQSMQEEMDPRGGRAERELPRTIDGIRREIAESYRPPINLTWRMQRAGARSEAEMVDRLLAELLAIDPSADVRGSLNHFVNSERESAGVDKGRLLDYPEICESILRRLAHLILSLPEAQLG